MLSNFKKITLSVIGDKKEKVYKSEKTIGEIEKKLDKEEINLAEAMNRLKSVFRYNLSHEDYRKIEKEVSYNIH